MKKAISIFIVMFVLCFPSLALASYTPAAPVKGVSQLINNIGSSVIVGTVSNVNNAFFDGDLGTSISVSNNSEIKVTLNNAVNMTHFYLKAESGQTAYRILDAASECLYCVMTSGISGVTSGVTLALSLNGVKYIEISNYSGVTGILYETDLYFVDTFPPANATGLTVSSKTDTTAALSFTTPADSDFQQYKIYQNGNLIYTSPNGTSKSTAQTQTASGLAPNTSYTFKVTSLDVLGNESTGATVTTTTNLPPAPPIPTGLTGTAGDGQATISWNAMSGASGYNLYQNGIKVSGSPFAGVSKLITGLSNGTTYNYQVSSLNSYGVESAKSGVVAVKPLPPKPSKPAGLIATVGTGKAQLSWTADQINVVKYNIYKDGVYLNTVSYPTNSFLVTGLTNGTSYSFTINAENSGGVSPGSDPVAATPIAVPTGVSAAPGNQLVTLNWNAVTTATNYRIYLNGILQTTTSTMPYDVTGLTNFTNYSFQIVAVSNNGASDKTTAVTAAPLPPLPEKPTGLTTTVGTGKVKLSWVTRSDNYILRYHIYKDGVYFNTADYPANNFIVTGLANGTEYSFTINAENAVGVSLGSDPVAATPIAVPTGVSAAPGNQLVTLNWDAVATATSYKVFKDTALIATTTAPYAATGLTNGTSYQFKVAAVASNGESDESAAVTAIPILAAPTGFTATPGNTIVTLDWYDVGGATKYKIYQNGSLLTMTATKPYIVHGLTNGTVYSYEVSAVQGGVESAKTEVITAKPDNPAVPNGVEAITGNKSIEVHWLPVHNATSYKIYMDGSLLATVTTIPYLATGLTNGTSYTFAVTALNAMGESELSAAVSAIPINATVPTGLAARISDAKVMLSWIPVTPPATKYVIFRDGVLLAEPTGTSYDDLAVTNGTTYKYEVAAVSGLGTSASVVAFAKPSANVKDFSGLILPFSVLDMLKTALNYILIYGKWVLIVLGIILVPMLFGFVASLLGFEEPKGKGKKRSGAAGKGTRKKSPNVSRAEFERLKQQIAKRNTPKPERAPKLERAPKPERAKEVKPPRTIHASDGKQRNKDGKLSKREIDRIEQRAFEHALKMRNGGRR